MRLELNGANVLILVRDKIANDLPSLCRQFEMDPHSSYYVESLVHQLEDAGLIVDIGNGNYYASGNLRKITNTLKLSLHAVAALGSRSMVVEPYFGPPDKLTHPIDLFVVMPFQDSLKPVWEDHIKNAARALGLTVTRADDFFTTHSVMSDVWTAICQSRAIIADCTGRNPNVFYEIGLAHAIGKSVVLITQNSDDVPFDVRYLRYIQYEYTPRGMQAFEQKLEETLKIELGLS